MQIPSGPANQPLVSSNQFARGFSGNPADGGGTITVASDVKLYIADENDSISSNITFQGATTTCVDCRVVFGASANVVNQAILTLGKGVQIENGTWGNGGGNFYIGSATETGHIVTLGGSTESEWPRIAARGGNPRIHTIEVQGSGSNSSVNVDGLRIVNSQNNSSGVPVLNFVSEFDITKLDNIHFDNSTTSDAATTTTIKLSNCTGSTSTGSWNNLQFNDGYSTGKNVDAEGTDCTIGNGFNITIYGEEDYTGYGAADEADTNGIITWDYDEAPTIAIDEPKDNDDQTKETEGGFSITWTDSDGDSDAQITLYYRDTAADCDAVGVIANWTEIANSISEDGANTYTWNSGIPAANDDYYICAKIADDHNETFSLSAGYIHVNAAPTVSLTQPDGVGDSILEGLNYTGQIFSVCRCR